MEEDQIGTEKSHESLSAAAGQALKLLLQPTTLLEKGTSGERRATPHFHEAGGAIYVTVFHSCCNSDWMGDEDNWDKSETFKVPSGVFFSFLEGIDFGKEISARIKGEIVKEDSAYGYDCEKPYHNTSTEPAEIKLQLGLSTDGRKTTLKVFRESEGGEHTLYAELIQRTPPEEDSRFRLMKDFALTVPKEYDHLYQMRNFFANRRENDFSDFTEIDNVLFLWATNKAVAGRTYTVKIFEIVERVSAPDCLEFLKSANAVFLNIQGASLVYQEAKNELLAGYRYFSLDEIDALAIWEHVEPNSRWMPFVAHNRHGWQFNIERMSGALGGGWGGTRDCLLCFCE
jgi:hypothetical protein